MRPIPYAAALAVALASCASQTAPTETASASTEGRQCFFTRNVSSFSAVDDTTVMLRVGVNDFYRLTLFAPCPDLKFTEGVALRNIGGGSSLVCDPTDAEFIVPSSIGPRTCALNAIHKLSPAEVAVLAPRDKP